MMSGQGYCSGSIGLENHFENVAGIGEIEKEKSEIYLIVRSKQHKYSTQLLDYTYTMKNFYLRPSLSPSPLYPSPGQESAVNDWPAAPSTYTKASFRSTPQSTDLARSKSLTPS